MAVTFFTSGAQKLRDEFDARIAQREPKDRITTWEKSSDGNFYTHKAAEWMKQAKFKAVVYGDRLVFNIVRPDNANISAVAYAYYHGHLTETFLNHFDQLFTAGQSSALPAIGDVCSA